MAYGFNVWRADGKLQVTSEGGISRIVGQYFKKMIGQSYIDSGTADGAVQTYIQAVPGLLPNGRWVVLVAGPNDGTPANTADVVKTVINVGSFTASVPYQYAIYNNNWNGVLTRGYPTYFTVISL